MDLDLSQFRDAFLDEAEENLAAVEAGLLRLEQVPDDSETLNNVFRAAHSIKGGCGNFGLHVIEALTHALEDLLGDMRDGRSCFDGPRLGLMLKATDVLAARLATARQDDFEGDHRDDVSTTLSNELQLARMDTPDATAPSSQQPAQPAEPADVAGESTSDSADDTSRGSQWRARVMDTTAALRVPAARLDELIDLVGELVITQLAVQQAADDGHDLRPHLDTLRSHTRVLQEQVMAVRMIPLGTLFNRYERLVREVSQARGRKARLVVHGGETELDKSLVEMLADPLTHLVRNAVDHGIESEAQRVALGKDPWGTVSLEARHESGHVVVTISDDGAGLDLQAIRRRAESCGLLREHESPSDARLRELIFEPGFTTAQSVTEFSGRGVGLDVVRINIAALHGSLEIESKPGQGTTMRIRLPLTLAILDALSLDVGGRTFMLPVRQVRESLRPRPSDISSVLGRGDVVLVRGETVPLLRLGDLLDVPGANRDPTQGLMILVEHLGSPLGLLADGMSEAREVVIKSLQPHIDRIDGVLGGAIMGDGQVALILDVAGLVRLASTRSAPAGDAPREPLSSSAGSSFATAPSGVTS